MFSGLTRPAILALVAAALVGLASDARASMGELTLTTNYAFGTPANNLNGFVGSPDTGYFEIQNTGTGTFTGFVDVVALSPGGDRSSGPFAVTLGAGDFVTLAVGPESSNDGGFNGTNPDGTNVGAILNVSGTLANCIIDVSYNDSQFHSGVFRTNPFGETLDNYVIQGGTAFGGDTGDDYEVSQAPGVIRVECPSTVPEPSTFAIAGVSGLLCLATRRLRRRIA
jgi:hypothetical protein